MPPGRSSTGIRPVKSSTVDSTPIGHGPASRIIAGAALSPALGLRPRTPSPAASGPRPGGGARGGGPAPPRRGAPPPPPPPGGGGGGGPRGVGGGGGGFIADRGKLGEDMRRNRRADPAGTVGGRRRDRPSG